MKKAKLLAAIHFHQPIGALEREIEKAYKQHCLPFVEALENHPRIKLSISCSGVLYDWLLEKHPEFLEKLKKLVRRRQVEILSGGYYEPFLSLIPDEDKIGQIETANEFIKERLGFAPRGIRLAEKDWEPHFPKVLSRAGVEYAVGEGLFENTGGYYVTEDQGQILKVFSYLEAAQVKDLIENSDQAQFSTYSDYLDENPALGRVYLSQTSGELKDSLAKNPQANNLHKKMLYVSNRLHTLREGKILIGEREKDQKLKEAARNLYKGQCGDAYRHEILRPAVYSHLIAAEKEIEKQVRGGRPYVDLTVMDFDKDGSDEVILANDLLNLCFAPACGGALFELDYKPKIRNLAGYSFLDRFLSQDADLAMFSQKKDRGFPPEKYAFLPKRRSNEVGLRLSGEKKIEGMPVKVEKDILLCLKQSIVNVEYGVTNLGKEKDEFRFGVEFNFLVRDKGWSEVGGEKNASSLKIVDEGGKFEVLLEWDRKALVWSFPAPSGLMVFPSWKFNLEPGQTWKVKLVLRIEE